MKTLIQGGTVIGFDGKGHVLIPGGVVVLEDDRVVHVGKSFAGPVDRRLDATGTLVGPGFVNVHFHASTEAAGRFILDVGRPDVLGSGYLNYSAPRRGQTGISARESARVGGRFALAELLRFGSTTAVEVGGIYGDQAELVDEAGKLGIRAYICPGFGSARYVTTGDGRLEWEWDEGRGFAGLERAKAFIKEYDGAHGGRIRCMLYPLQVDTCSPKLLAATREAANQLKVRVQVHTGQSQLEFIEILRRHQRTPIELLEDTGLLGPDLIVAHCVYVTGHSRAIYPRGRDLERIAASGATVAHSPSVFARRGVALESFHKYRQAGIPIALGTDTYPRDLLNEMRVASLVCKVKEGDLAVATAAEMFTAATLGGAAALGRDDLGRLAPGAKADVVIINLRKLRFGPVRDPIRALITCAVGDDVETVFVDGRVVVEEGRVLGVDEQELLTRTQAEAERLWATAPEWDWKGRHLDEISPPSFPVIT